jgi:hypothetical protein
MITMSTNEIADFSPCVSGMRKLLKALDKKKADDEQIPLTVILDAVGIIDTIWGFRVTWHIEAHRKVYLQFMQNCVKRANAYAYAPYANAYAAAYYADAAAAAYYATATYAADAAAATYAVTAATATAATATAATATTYSTITAYYSASSSAAAERTAQAADLRRLLNTGE